MKGPTNIYHNKTIYRVSINFGKYGLYLLAFLVSLTGIEFLTPLGSVSISVIFVSLCSAFLFLYYRKISKNYIAFITGAVALSMIYTGFYHSLFTDIFSAISHFKSVLKMLIVLIMALTFPVIFSRISHVQLFKAIVFIIRIHAILLILDSFFYSPIDWSDAGVILNERVVDYHRPRGLFGEPSRFVIFQSILLATLLFLENRIKQANLKPFDIILVLASILLSSSLFGVILCCVFVLQCRSKIFSFKAGIASIFNKNKIKFSSFGFVIIISIFVIYFLYFSQEYEYIQSRLINVLEFKDGSTRGRLIGGVLSIVDVLENTPFTGYGGGNWNQEHNIDPTLLSEYSNQQGSVVMSNTMFWSALAIMGGIVPILLYILLFFWVLSKRYYYYLLIMFLVTLGTGLYYYPIFWISLVLFNYCLTIDDNRT